MEYQPVDVPGGMYQHHVGSSRDGAPVWLQEIMHAYRPTRPR